MAAKIRLKKTGKKGQASYRVVVLDGRKPRDAKVVADLGYYDPKTNPASYEIDHESALEWLRQGAKATKAARDLLSKSGVMAAWDAVTHAGVEPSKAQELASQVAEAAKMKEAEKAKTKVAKKEEKRKAKKEETEAETALEAPEPQTEEATEGQEGKESEEVAGEPSPDVEAEEEKEESAEAKEES
jgi:small subunit ribosomal protein S16